jgi:3-phosphoshikimate 1-carboxyvinyltransferase
VESKRIRRGQARGSVQPPGSKSISNRALVAASLAGGVTEIAGLLIADDTNVMIAGLQALGVQIALNGTDAEVTGPTEFRSAVIDVGGSGTTMRFLAGLAAVIDAEVSLDGSPRMRDRPISGLVDALQTLGVEAEYLAADGFPPLRIIGSRDLRRSAEVDASESSQFASALMLAAPFWGEGLTLRFKGGRAASSPYLQTTVEVMRSFGVDVSLARESLTVHPGRYSSTKFAVEPDASSAVFMWGAAAVTGGSVAVTGIGAHSTQADLGVLGVLKDMGCSVSRSDAEILVEGPSKLRGVEADLSHCPDGALMLAVAASTAKGTTLFSGLHTLRLKETDRLLALQTELRKVGATVVTTDDSITITPGRPTGAFIETYNDHRMAMAFGVLALAHDDLTVLDPECVHKTWPEFWHVLDSINSNRVVAIDGHAGVGKTSVSKAVAEALGFVRLDTGALYRAATVVGMRNGVALSDEAALISAIDAHPIAFESGHVLMDGIDICEAIREDAVSRNVSEVSAHPAVRARMVDYQRAWVEDQSTGVVAEGRDMGTVVFPDASVKIFLSARAEVRAARRAEELPGELAAIAADMAERDRKDSTREISPTRKASDAHEIDTSDIGVAEVVARVVEYAEL